MQTGSCFRTLAVNVVSNCYLFHFFPKKKFIRKPVKDVTDIKISLARTKRVIIVRHQNLTLRSLARINCYALLIIVLLLKITIIMIF